MKPIKFAAVATSLGVALGGLVAAPGITSAGATTPKQRAHQTSFTSAQQVLEQRLAARERQLSRLSSDVTASKTLSSSDGALLSVRLVSETASIDALASKVPTDTTFSELRSDHRAMIRANRVYAVMTPQVFETIEADSISSQVSMLEGEEASLSSSVSSLVGEVGHGTAARHYRDFVTVLARAQRDSADVITTVLAQVPADFPGDTHVFVNANRRLLNAQVAIAHADYDANVVGLASGGYSGS